MARAAPYAVALAIAAALYAVATHFDFQPRPGTLGPDVWPKAILACAMAVCAWQIAVALAAHARRDAEDLLASVAADGTHGQAGGPVPQAAARHPVRVALGMAATAAYVLLVTPLGFFLATFGYLALFLALAGYPHRRVIAVVSLLGTLVLMLVFMKLVYVSLPLGQGAFARPMLLLMQLMAIR
jgi:hypothetical protein